MAENPRESDVINGVHGKLIYNGTWPTDLPEDKPLELRLKMLRLDVDVSDALTGLKALRREADAAIRSLKALEQKAGHALTDEERRRLAGMTLDDVWGEREYFPFQPEVSE